MKTLVILRHAEFDGRELTPNGKLLLSRLIERVRTEWNPAYSLAILSAPSPRVQETAGMIARQLNAPPALVVKDLDGEGFKFPSSEQWERIVATVTAQEAGVAIAVMHREETETMVHKIAPTLGMQDRISGTYIPKLGHNDALVLDTETKAVRHVWVEH